MSLKIYEGDKAINAALAKLEKTAVSFKWEVQSLLVSVTLHHARHGDTTGITNVMNKTCDIMKDMSHKNAVNRWFEAFACVSWSSEKKCFVHSKTKVEAAAQDFEAFTAKITEAKSYWEMTKPDEFKPVKILTPLIAAINRYYNMTEEERASPLNDLEGLQEAITFVKKHGKGDKLKVPGAPLSAMMN